MPLLHTNLKWLHSLYEDCTAICVAHYIAYRLSTAPGLIRCHCDGASFGPALVMMS